MCLFINMFLPACSSDSLSALDTIALRHRRQLYPLDDSSIKACLKQGEQYFCLARKKRGCDCDTRLGCLADEHEPLTVGQSPMIGSAYYEQINKLRTEGWSEAEIIRFQQQKQTKYEEALAENEQRIRQRLGSRNNDNWYAMLDEMLASKRVKYVGLLLTWRLRNKPIRNLARQPEPINLRKIGSGCLAYLHQDVLYEFC
ncbi:MAG: hypothetical protein FWH15_06745 [Betaproteobacteria bacterium]|nr:hypothetical protein [Betaproteobacteria bacterium]